MREYHAAYRFRKTNGVRKRRRTVGVEIRRVGFIFIVADRMCTRCRYFFAPYPELWGTTDLCAFCAEDAGICIQMEIAL